MAKITPLMLGLHQSATNLGSTYEFKNFGFLELMSSHETFAIRSQASVYTDGERATAFSYAWAFQKYLETQVATPLCNSNGTFYFEHEY